jgi:hypothetical protein
MLVDYKMSNDRCISSMVVHPLNIGVSQKIEYIPKCINDTCLNRNNCLRPVGKIECPVCNIVSECYMQPICKHFLCKSCITKTYYIDDDIEEIPRCLNKILTKKIPEKDMIEDIKKFNYETCIRVALIKEMRECPVCIR